jgi:hypothetical protein
VAVRGQEGGQHLCGGPADRSHANGLLTDWAQLGDLRIPGLNSDFEIPRQIERFHPRQNCNERGPSNSHAGVRIPSSPPPPPNCCLLSCSAGLHRCFSVDAAVRVLASCQERLQPNPPRITAAVAKTRCTKPFGPLSLTVGA